MGILLSMFMGNLFGTIFYCITFYWTENHLQMCLSLYVSPIDYVSENSLQM